jgi:hypothetical protein
MTDFPAPAICISIPQRNWEGAIRIPGQYKNLQSSSLTQSMNSGDIVNHSPVLGTLSAHIALCRESIGSEVSHVEMSFCF